jgi:uncharacterized membrane-anchored protein
MKRLTPIPFLLLLLAGCKFKESVIVWTLGDIVGLSILGIILAVIMFWWLIIKLIQCRNMIKEYINRKK